VDSWDEVDESYNGGEEEILCLEVGRWASLICKFLKGATFGDMSNLESVLLYGILVIRLFHRVRSP